MTCRLSSVSLPLALLVIASCAAACGGGALDLGSDTTPRDAPSAPIVLSVFAELPDFWPATAAIAGDAVFVQGATYPGGTWDPEAKGTARIVRVPLRGGLAREVWRGDRVYGAMVPWNGKVAFRTRDLNESPVTQGHRGVTLLDAATGAVLELPAPEPEDAFVATLRAGANGLHWTTLTRARSTVARWADSERRVETLIDLDDASILLFEDDGDVAALVREPGSQVADTYALGASGVERRSATVSTQLRFLAGRSERFVGLMASANATNALVQWRRQTEPGREALATPAVIGPDAFGAPIVTPTSVYWVPGRDRGAVRRSSIAAVEADPTRATTEHARDPGREIQGIASDGAWLVWISVPAIPGDPPYRLMAMSL